MKKLMMTIVAVTMAIGSMTTITANAKEETYVTTGKYYMAELVAHAQMWAGHGLEKYSDWEFVSLKESDERVDYTFMYGRNHVTIYAYPEEA